MLSSSFGPRAQEVEHHRSRRCHTSGIIEDHSYHRRDFGGPVFRLHVASTLKKAAVYAYETLLSFYRTTQCHQTSSTWKLHLVPQ